MDDLVNPSFFDYTGTPHNTISPGLDLQGSGLESIIKQETYDSSTWMHSCHDLTPGMDNGFQTTSYAMGLESLINTTTATSSSNHRDSIDPLEYILNQPQLENLPLDGGQCNILSVKQESDLHSSDFPNTALSFHDTTDNTIQFKVDGKSCIPTNEVPQSGSIVPLNSTPPDSIPDQVVVKKEETLPKEPEMKLEPEDLNLYVSNVVASFRVRCHLNLRRIAREGVNVIYKKDTKKILMRLRHPSCTAYIWSSGKIVCTGANSEISSKKAARKIARRLQDLGFSVVFSNFKIINALAVFKMPYHINIVEFSKFHKSKNLSYEPEIHPAVTYRFPEWKVSFKIFSTGSVTLTCPVIARIPDAVRRLTPQVRDFFRLDKPSTLNANLSKNVLPS